MPQRPTKTENELEKVKESNEIENWCEMMGQPAEQLRVQAHAYFSGTMVCFRWQTGINRIGKESRSVSKWIADREE